jgi:MFS family permease
MSARGAPWRHRDFALLWGGQTISEVGSAVSLVVLPLIAVVYLHASGLAVGALAAVQWAPWLLIGLPAGVWVDRSRKRPLMIGCDVVRALAIASVPLAAAFGTLHMFQLYVAGAVAGVATVVFEVAYQAYLPALLPSADLQEANAKLQGSQAVAQLAGPGLGGVLVQLVRAPYALVVDAASYVLSVAGLLAIRADEPRPATVERHLRREIAEGGRYVLADPLLRVMTISPAIGNFFFTGFEAIVVLFLVRSVHLAPGSVGLLIGIGSLGSVVGAVVARPLGRRFGTARALMYGIVLTTPFGLLIPLTTRGAGLGIFVASTVLMFAGILVYNVTISAFRQAYCPPRLLGRVVASMRFVLFGTMPLGALAGGALADAVGPRSAAWILLAGNVLGGLVLCMSPLPRLRDLPARPVGLAEPRAAAAHT